VPLSQPGLHFLPTPPPLVPGVGTSELLYAPLFLSGSTVGWHCTHLQCPPTLGHLAETELSHSLAAVWP
jgi:hypothetical protein